MTVRQALSSGPPAPLAWPGDAKPTRTPPLAGSRASGRVGGLGEEGVWTASRLSVDDRYPCSCAADLGADVRHDHTFMDATDDEAIPPRLTPAPASCETSQPALTGT